MINLSRIVSFPKIADYEILDLYLRDCFDNFYSDKTRCQLILRRHRLRIRNNYFIFTLTTVLVVVLLCFRVVPFEMHENDDNDDDETDTWSQTNEKLIST